MAVKDVPPVIDLLEEDEEEWPEAGAQNPEEAEQCVDKINNIFDHLSTLIHDDKKMHWARPSKTLRSWLRSSGRR